MNILYLDHYAGSLYHGRSFRPYYLGKEWIKSGHKLTVVAGTYSHVRTKQPDRVGLENIDGINYLWLTTPTYEGNGVKRFLSMFIFMMQLFLNMNKILKLSKPDVIIGSTVYMLDMFPAWIMKKITKARLVFELHDIWPLSPMELGNMSRFHPFILIMSMAEYFTYNIADIVVSILPKTYDHIKEFGVKKSQFFHIPNGIDLEDWEDKGKVPENIRKLIFDLRQKDDFIIGYAGAHGLPQALYVMLDAAKILKDKKVHFILIGDGQEKKNLQQYAKDNCIDNVTFISRISKNEIPATLKSMDALYLGLQNQPLFRFGTSMNKLFDYMMAAKPIIHSVTAGNDPVLESKSGISVPAGDAKKVAAAILEMKQKTQAERNELGKNGREYVLKNHDYRKLAKDFLKCIT